MFFKGLDEYVTAGGDDVQLLRDVGEVLDDLSGGAEPVDVGQLRVDVEIFPFWRGEEDAFNRVFKNSSVGVRMKTATVRRGGVRGSRREKRHRRFIFQEIQSQHFLLPIF